MANWRELGDTTVEAFKSEFIRLNSPMVLQATDVWAAARPHSALALAMMWVEQKYATLSSIPSRMHNPLSLARPDGTPADGDDRWESYDTWADGVAAWKERITSLTYKPANPGVYARTITLADLVSVYAPPSENDSGRYLAQLWERLALFPGNQEPGPMALRVVQNILPAGASNHPSTKLDASQGWIAVTCHQTGNPSPGAGAENQTGYMHSPDARMRQAAWHMSVDDLVIAQGLELDVIGWHAADGCNNWATDVGCFRSIAIEGCINQGANYVRAIENYAECIAMLVRGDPQFNWGDGRARGKVSAQHLFQHLQVSDPGSDQHYCPQQLLSGLAGITWTKFLDMVDQRIEGAVKPQFGPVILFPRYKVAHTVKGALSRKAATGASTQVVPYAEGTALRLTASRQGQRLGDTATWFRIQSGGPSQGAWIHASGLAEVSDPKFETIGSVVVHATPGAITRVGADRTAEMVTQFTKRTALRIKGVQEGQEALGSNKWFVIASKGPSNETLIHASGLEKVPEVS